MVKYEVGKAYEKAICHAEGCYLDITDGGMDILLYFCHPTKCEKEEIREGKDLEIRLLNFPFSMMFLLKFGSLDWMDAPYTPHLSKNLTSINCEKGKGLSASIMLFDTGTGVLEAMRYIALSDEFTRTIKQETEKLLKQEFDKADYYSKINSLFSSYATMDFVNISKPGFRIE